MRGGPLAGAPKRRRVPVPEWYDELDVGGPTVDASSLAPGDQDANSQERDSSPTLAYCFLRVSRLGCGVFDLLTRYETALWRQAAQLLFMLQTMARP